MLLRFRCTERGALCCISHLLLLCAQLLSIPSSVRFCNEAFSYVILCLEFIANLTASESVFLFSLGLIMSRSNSKALATVSTPPPDKVLGGPRNIASESDCVNSGRSSIVDECEVINVDSVPCSSVKKGL